MKFIGLLGILVVTVLIFGWVTILPGLVIGVVVLIWMIKRDTAQTQSPAETWGFMPCDDRGNRFMLDDPLDAPRVATDTERQDVLRLILPQRQLNSELIEMRHRMLSEPKLLETADGIDMMNALGYTTYLSVAHQVTNWQTNDFRQLGVELLVV